MEKSGAQGPQGPQGEPFTFEDFTEAQIESLRGPKGQSIASVPTGAILAWNGNEEEPPEGYEFIEIEIETGTSDYEQLINKPKIEGEELLGNKTFEELNLKALTNLELEELINSQVFTF